jgi:hypothetical protein
LATASSNWSGRVLARPVLFPCLRRLAAAAEPTTPRGGACRLSAAARFQLWQRPQCITAILSHERWYCSADLRLLVRLSKCGHAFAAPRTGCNPDSSAKMAETVA